MNKIIYFVCLIIWIGWLIYGIVGKDFIVFKVGLICGSVVSICYYSQLLLGILK
jgi:hypothetical protein